MSTARPMLTLTQLAQMAGGELVLPAADAAAPRPDGVDGAAIDTRALRGGELFVPLPGTRVDGHTFLEEAFRRGAGAALCARAHWGTRGGVAPGPLVVVEDVTTAFGALAHRWRESWHGLLIGITGSAGKTTTKDLVALVLGTAMPTLRTQGNLNNQWGVPLTLMGLRHAHAAAVVEMGMNQPGEIAMLAAMAAPSAAVITTVGRAHLERFGTIEAVAREKAALAFALRPAAPLFIGADVPALRDALAGTRARVVTYGFASDADVRPEWIEALDGSGVRFQVAGFPPVHLRLVGRHQVANALGAIAIAREYQLDHTAVVQALEGYAGGQGRMEVRTSRGATLLVDCYNANPESSRAALETLAGWTATRRIALLGDMLELGDTAAALHAEVGAAVRDAELWTVGAHADDTASGGRGAGVEVRRFASKADMAAALREALAPGVVVLLKASRGAALEDVLQGLDDPPSPGGGPPRAHAHPRAMRAPACSNGV